MSQVAETISALPAFDMDAAPISTETVTLAVRDLNAVTAFYRDVLGLSVLSHDAARAVLGTDRRALVELIARPGITPRDPRQAGLFHTAFLLPDRADLGRWLVHAAGLGVRLHGASDHLVSEAVYLADPEGNGIEIYADRTPDHWTDADGAIQMATLPLDLDDLVRAAAGTRWTGLPEGGRVGHVHLQVGAIDPAEDFYADLLGFDVAAKSAQALFFGTGGYHHQLAGNIWNSRGAGRRPDDAAGLERVTLRVADAATLQAIAARTGATPATLANGATALDLTDPWGTQLRLVTRR